MGISLWSALRSFANCFILFCTTNRSICKSCEALFSKLVNELFALYIVYVLGSDETCMYCKDVVLYYFMIRSV